MVQVKYDKNHANTFKMEAVHLDLTSVIVLMVFSASLFAAAASLFYYVSQMN